MNLTCIDASTASSRRFTSLANTAGALSIYIPIRMNAKKGWWRRRLVLSPCLWQIVLLFFLYFFTSQIVACAKFCFIPAASQDGTPVEGAQHQSPSVYGNQRQSIWYFRHDYGHPAESLHSQVDTAPFVHQYLKMRTRLENIYIWVRKTVDGLCYNEERNHMYDLNGYIIYMYI